MVNEPSVFEPLKFYGMIPAFTSGLWSTEGESCTSVRRTLRLCLTDSVFFLRGGVGWVLGGGGGPNIYGKSVEM